MLGRTTARASTRTAEGPSEGFGPQSVVGQAAHAAPDVTADVTADDTADVTASWRLTRHVSGVCRAAACLRNAAVGLCTRYHIAYRIQSVPVVREALWPVIQTRVEQLLRTTWPTPCKIKLPGFVSLVKKLAALRLLDIRAPFPETVAKCRGQS